MSYQLDHVLDTDPEKAYLALGISEERIDIMENEIRTIMSRRTERLSLGIVQLAAICESPEELAYFSYSMGMAIAIWRCKADNLLSNL